MKDARTAGRPEQGCSPGRLSHERCNRPRHAGRLIGGTACDDRGGGGDGFAYLAANVRTPDDATRLVPFALIDGYHTAFYWGAGLLAAALVTSIVMIRVGRDALPADDDTAVPTDAGLA